MDRRRAFEPAIRKLCHHDTQALGTSSGGPERDNDRLTKRHKVIIALAIRSAPSGAAADMLGGCHEMKWRMLLMDHLVRYGNLSLDFNGSSINKMAVSSHEPNFKSPVFDIDTHLLKTNLYIFTMVRISTIAAGFSVIYGAAQATPMPGKRAGNGHGGLGGGYDPELKKLFGPDSIVPELTIVDQELSRNVSFFGDGSPFTTPFIPPTDPTNDKRFIVGVDDRRYNGDTNYPWSAIGRIVTSEGWWCSAALVGSRHVLTAQHCLPSPQGSITFYPSYDIAPRLGQSPVTNILATGWVFDGPCENKNDWAVLILQDRLGDTNGWLGSRYPDVSKFDQPIFEHQGYPEDKEGGQRPYYQGGTKVRSDISLECDATGPLITDNDVQGGQSGGPLWTKYADGPYIWGVCVISVTSSEDTFAGFASGDLMVDTIANARSAYQ
jgi:V8-like Glu-specific endopeptidase